jgi:hypothetical protein
MNVFKALYVLLVKQTLCSHQNKEEIAMVEAECTFDRGTYYRNLILKCKDCEKMIDVEYTSTFVRELK